jgi:hypothetical protein
MKSKQQTQVSLLLLAVSIIFFGCTSTDKIAKQGKFPEPDNFYDSEFPVKNLSTELDFISTTVKKLDCLAFYMTYVFPENNTINAKYLSDSILRKYAVSSTVNNESVTGTAMVVYADWHRVGLLTCAHIIDFPDTIITRFDNGKGEIQSVSLKIKQQNFVKDLPAGKEIEILAVDKDSDIAFIGKVLDDNSQLPAVLNYPVGKTKDLQWGSVVYVMGYPVGNLMVTRAIVSNPAKAERGKFLTDALYNRGISGSPVFAIRDGIPNFELVGMASSAAAKQIYYLKPGNEQPEFINPEKPFDGDLFVDQYKQIKYGVTFNVCVEVITDFLKRNRENLSRKGFDPERFFK